MNDMTVFQGILLGALQGVAEFLPISSSGHLAVAQNLLGFDDVPLLFDVFLHLATLASVCIYFRKKIARLFVILGRWIARKPADKNAPLENDDVLCGNDYAGRKTIIAILLTTFITGIIGVINSKLIPELSIKFTCAGFLVTSCLLIISSLIEKKRTNTKKDDATSSKSITIKQATLIGIMQGIGTLPGISRSGSTISGALFSNLDRKAAGDYSFIVSIPAILGAFILELKDLDEMTGSIGAAPIIAGCAAAFAVGYVSLYLLMKLLRKGNLQWFAAYLIPAGILGLIFLH